MKNILAALVLAVFTASAAFAQADDYKKGEVFVGFSHGQVDTGFGDDDSIRDFVDNRESFNGFNVSGVYNVHRYVGIKADVSGTYNNKSYSFSIPTGPSTSGTLAFDTNNSLYNFLGGVQVKDNSTEGRFKPFAHALVGAGHVRTKIKNSICPTGGDCSFLNGNEGETGFAGAFGGGLDIKVNNKLDFRAFQVDYNPVRVDGMTLNNFRFGIGVVFK